MCNYFHQFPLFCTFSKVRDVNHYVLQQQKILLQKSCVQKFFFRWNNTIILTTWIEYIPSAKNIWPNFVYELFNGYLIHYKIKLPFCEYRFLQILPILMICVIKYSKIFFVEMQGFLYKNRFQFKLFLLYFVYFWCNDAW